MIFTQRDIYAGCAEKKYYTIITSCTLTRNAILEVALTRLAENN